jgi:hypothetical protein
MCLNISKLRALCSTKTLFIDASFFMAPDGWYQVLTFHGVLPNGRTFVAGFVLMQHKNEKNYREVFFQLKNIVNLMKLRLNPEVIMTDFERALQNSISKEFTNSKLVGCWFHFSQSLRRRSVRIFGQIAVNKDYNLYRWLTKYSTLALTPIDKMNDALGILMSKTF